MESSLFYRFYSVRVIIAGNFFNEKKNPKCFSLNLNFFPCNNFLRQMKIKKNNLKEMCGKYYSHWRYMHIHLGKWNHTPYLLNQCSFFLSYLIQLFDFTITPTHKDCYINKELIFIKLQIRLRDNNEEFRMI